MAVELPEEACSRLAALRTGLSGIRWTQTANPHLTVRFIGDVPSDFSATVENALGTVRAAPFSLRIRGLGLFTHKRQNILWAGLEPCPELLDLKRRVDAALAYSAGLESDTGCFTPHITLARMGASLPSGARPFVDGHASVPFGFFRVDHFTLFSSVLTSAGAVHTREDTYALRFTGTPLSER